MGTAVTKIHAAAQSDEVGVTSVFICMVTGFGFRLNLCELHARHSPSNL
jgi:hypothetical protein